MYKGGDKVLALDQVDLGKEKSNCWDESFHAFGTGYIFESRAKRYGFRLRILEFLGLGVPACVGAVVVSLGYDFKYFDIILFIASSLSIFQFIMAMWALVSGWNDHYAYSLESSYDNYRISNEFKLLAKNPPSKMNFKLKYEILQKENELRAKEDYKRQISEKEKRKGMRAALRQFQRACAGCGQAPQNMKSSNCDICGKF
jgi:mobilome CxxCx(11)CxxC protein